MHRDGERERRQRRQRVEQLVDLERADDAAANALVRGERGDVVAVEEDRPRGRLENAGEQVDQRRLAGAVRSDQGVARAAREVERDVVGRRQAAEALDERARREDGRHGFAARAEPRPGPHEALAPDEHQHDQEQAEPEVPVLRRPRRDQVVQQLEDDRAEDAAVEIARAADDEDEQHLGAAMEVEDVERGEAGRLREQRAGRAGDPSGEGVDRDQPQRHRQADARRAQPVVAQRLQRDAERRVDEAARDEQNEREHDERVGVGGSPGEIEVEALQRRERDRDRAHDDALQAVGAAGQPVELVGELVEDRGDAERHHQPRQVAAAQDEDARRQAEERARGDRDDQADDRIGHHVLREQRRRVRAEAEERGVAERDDAGVAEDEVERDREQGDDRDLVEEQRLRRQQQPRERQRREQRELPPAPARVAAQRARRRCERRAGRRRRRSRRGRVAHRALARANRPCGRQSRIATISV